MDSNPPPGVFDILPFVQKDSWRETHLWDYVEKACRQVAFEMGLSEVRTPIFERADLFRRTVGDETDIVSKEMYIFEDLGGRELALRPEGTAPVMRALLKEGKFSRIHSLRYFYIGPMFRYERPQSGRFRQHHQFGVEVLGNSAPEQDAELISMLMRLYRRLGLPDLKVFVNSLGDQECRSKFREKLVSYLSLHVSALSEDSQRRFERNPLRILDSKDPRDQEIVAKAPSILEFLSPEDTAHFHRVQDMLTYLHIPFEVSPLLVRGLDYYQKTVFELTSGKLGAQNSVGAGGRYDGLLKQLGGPDLPATGFGTGLERIIQLLLKQGLSDGVLPLTIPFMVIPLGEKERIKAVQIVEQLRERGIRSLVDFTEKRLKNAITAAVQSRVEWLLVLGEAELESGKATLKYLPESLQVPVDFEDIEALIRIIQSQQKEVER